MIPVIKTLRAALPNLSAGGIDLVCRDSTDLRWNRWAAICWIRLRKQRQLNVFAPEDFVNCSLNQTAGNYCSLSASHLTHAFSVSMAYRLSRGERTMIMKVTGPMKLQMKWLSILSQHLQDNKWTNLHCLFWTAKSKTTNCVQEWLTGCCYDVAKVF